MYVCLKHTYMLGGPCLDRPPEAQKIKFRTGSPECFKTIAETKVWTHFLVQAGYLDFGASEASDAEHVCMYKLMRATLYRALQACTWHVCMLSICKRVYLGNQSKLIVYSCCETMKPFSDMQRTSLHDQ